MPAGASMYGDMKQLLTPLTPHLDFPAFQCIQQTNRALCLAVKAVNPATWLRILRCRPRPNGDS